MIEDGRREAIQQLAAPILEAHQAELVELNLIPRGSQLTVRMLIDKVGGVTIHDCSQLNRRIGDAIDQAGVLTGYLLEVSSPGLDRPLVSRRDYERAIGEELDLDLVEPLGTKYQVSGKLLAVQPEAIVLVLRPSPEGRGSADARWRDGPPENVTIPLSRIRRARKTIRIGR